MNYVHPNTEKTLFALCPFSAIFILNSNLAEDFAHWNFGQNDKGRLTVCYVGTPGQRLHGQESLIARVAKAYKQEPLKYSSHSPIQLLQLV